MKYLVRLHKSKFVPYEVDVEANDENTAIEKAKEIVANIGYWGHDSKNIESRKNLLVVDYVRQVECQKEV